MDLELRLPCECLSRLLVDNLATLFIKENLYSYVVGCTCEGACMCVKLVAAKEQALHIGMRNELVVR